ncbi:reverse transcriptase [Purpureocillium lavendulum]|uniref:Reverse transcriptase n=1 Tax=Purpureocillium lavendulum TaxID=1247861 RepID=A0AB34FCS7_9HYPO|nr:reverse transcriptase [Purpureocillium lavendulum]
MTPSESQERTKKRKRDDLGHDQGQLLQSSPFKPKGAFATHETMDVAYDIEPRKKWFGMTRYKSFIYNGVKYHLDDYVCVTNDTIIKHQVATGTSPEHQGPPEVTDYWVARILEIRALDADNVYARVFWMYSPDELPPNTLTNEDFVSGRQLYHGQHELIASNHMDIINVVSVAMPAIVNHWLESEDEATQGALYWRQAFDCRTSELSSVDLVCICRSPANPDRMLVGCSNPECEKWLHYECLLHELLTQVYDDLGMKKPHYNAESPAKAVTETHPLQIPGLPQSFKGYNLNL